MNEYVISIGEYIGSSINNYPKKFFVLDKTGIVPKPLTIICENKEKEKLFHKTIKPFIEKGQGEVTRDEKINLKWEIDYLQLNMIKIAMNKKAI